MRQVFVDRPEKTVLSPEQISRLLHRLPEPSRPIVWLLVLTGLRIGELLALRWRDIDLEAGLLRLSRTLYEGHFDEPKTDDSNRTVPLSAKGIEILFSLQNERLASGRARIFHLSRRNLSNRPHDTVCEELGIPKIGWHSFCHSSTLPRRSHEEIPELGSIWVQLLTVA
jgi:integrase